MRLKVGDNVIVVAGKDKGKKGVITKVIRDEDRVVVEGVNVMKKHRKAKQEGAENIIEFSAPIHVSNVMFFDTKAKEPTRIGIQKVDSKNVRVTKKSKTQLK